MVDVDTVVIGSGAGGLTAALALAKAGQRVLVLEQHYLPGGWCHSFDLEGYTFSPGVHYIGELGPGGRMRSIYEGLGVARDLTFLELDPEGFDRVRIGADFRFDIPRGRDALVDRLSSRFPQDAEGIRRFVHLLGDIGHELTFGTRVHGLNALTLPFRCPNLARYGLRSLKSVLERHVSDPYARAVLSVQAGDHGMPPSRCPTALHAAVVAHYFEGGYYPKGGARSLPKAFVKALRRHGGQIRVRARVERILVEDGRAIGVRLSDGTEVRANHVVSNADPHATSAMIPAEALPRRSRFRLRHTPYSVSAISLFLAAELDPRARGMTSGNVWSIATPDVEDTYRYAMAADPLAQGEVPGVFVTCTTLKDPSERTDGIATFEAFTFVSYEAFRRFEGSAMDDRPAEYEALKEALGERMMRRVEEVVPGIRDNLRFKAVGTPLTNRFYVGSTEGNLYGIEKNVRQVGPFGWPLQTRIGGLWMCGASTLGHGVAGATLSGLGVARGILGLRTSEILTEKDELQVWQSEHPERWPTSARSTPDHAVGRQIA